MARYDYRCTDCGHGEEMNHSMAAPVITLICPACGAKAFERRIGVGVVIGDGRMRRDRKFPFVSQALPPAPATEGCERSDAEGQPVIMSRTHAKEVAKRNGYSWT